MTTTRCLQWCVCGTNNIRVSKVQYQLYFVSWRLQCLCSTQVNPRDWFKLQVLYKFPYKEIHQTKKLFLKFYSRFPLKFLLVLLLIFSRLWSLIITNIGTMICVYSLHTGSPISSNNGSLQGSFRRPGGSTSIPDSSSASDYSSSSPSSPLCMYFITAPCNMSHGCLKKFTGLVYMLSCVCHLFYGFHMLLVITGSWLLVYLVWITDL